MEGNNGQSPTPRQQDFGCFEAALKLAKFVVDVNADGLESLCRRVGFGIRPPRKVLRTISASSIVRVNGPSARAATMARAIAEPAVPRRTDR